MKRFPKTMAAVISGLMLASGAQAGIFTKGTPPANTPAPSQYQVVPVPQGQTAPPPLAVPLSTPLQPTASKNLPGNMETSVDLVSGTDASAQPRYAVVNHKLVLLSYDYKNVGPSGVSGVEVYFTRDGKGWQKMDGVQNENPAWVELEEGTFGLYLVARTGLGGGRAAPTEADQPQIWIKVDLTKPVVFLNSVQQSNGTRTLTINWTARDDDFGRQPINLTYADDTRGPWMPIATNIENTGSYTWQIPPSTPCSFYVRVEAVDLAGNADNSTSQSPIKIDLSQPSVTNIQLKPLPPK